MEIEELCHKFSETHAFLQCIGAIDSTYVEIKGPNEHYSDNINRKGYYSIHLQAVYDYRSCFLDVVVNWPGSVHVSRTFLNSSINKELRIGKIPNLKKF